MVKKEFLKIVSICRSYGQESSVLLWHFMSLWHKVWLYYDCITTFCWLRTYCPIRCFTHTHTLRVLIPRI